MSHVQCKASTSFTNVTEWARLYAYSVPLYFPTHQFSDVLLPEIAAVSRRHSRAVKSVLEPICPVEDRYMPAIVVDSDEWLRKTQFVLGFSLLPDKLNHAVNQVVAELGDRTGSIRRVQEKVGSRKSLHAVRWRPHCGNIRALHKVAQITLLLHCSKTDGPI